MLKTTIVDGKMFKQIVIPSSMILGDPNTGEIIDGAQLIPLELGGKLLPPRVVQTVSLTELGKSLLRAAEEGETDEVRQLMSKGAPFTADWLGTSPLHFAAQHNHLETCKVLLRAGISRDARTKVERTPLHLAAYEGHNDIVNVLLENGADIDAQDMLRMTPLHWAVQNGHTDVVRNLVKNGASVDAVNKFDLTPLDISLDMNHQQIIHVLTLEVRNPLSEVEHLTAMDIIETSNDSNTDHLVENPPIETVLLEDDEEDMETDRLHVNNEDEENSSENTAEFSHLQGLQDVEGLQFTDPMQLLRQHGITMLPNDEPSILSSVMENGHSVVLTEVGKDVFNSTKPVSMPATPTIPTISSKKSNQMKYVTIHSDRYLNLTPNVLKQIGNALPKGKMVKRIVMNSSKSKPLLQKQQIVNNPQTTDLEIVTRQLLEARKLAEDYKQQLKIKEAEAARYKYQLELITQQTK